MESEFVFFSTTLSLRAFMAKNRLNEKLGIYKVLVFLWKIRVIKLPDCRRRSSLLF